MKLLFLLLITASIALCAPAQDHLVSTKDLPGGLNPAWFKSKWYSGSYNVTKNRELHYIFVESQWQPDKDPVIVVMNGGTGAASTYLAF